MHYEESHSSTYVGGVDGRARISAMSAEAVSIFASCLIVTADFAPNAATAVDFYPYSWLRGRRERSSGIASVGCSITGRPLKID